MEAASVNIRDKAEKTVKKLLALTQDQKLEWEMLKDTGFLSVPADERVDIAYMVWSAGSRFVVYELHFYGIDAEERTYWDTRVQVDLVDEDLTLLWRLPQISGMRDLLDAIRISAGNVESKLDAFLEE